MSNELTKKQIQFLNRYTKGTWSFDPSTGLVDVDGDFDCSKKGLENFMGIKFGKVSMWFNCSDNYLTSLEGAPREVGWDFNCSNNRLTSLVGAPQEVCFLPSPKYSQRGFRCYGNKLTSLKGAPQKVTGDFICCRNNLTTLEGAPQEVGEDFSCGRNQLTSLEGAPQKVGGYFDCSNNNLTSLKGAPQEVGGDFDCTHNKLASSKELPGKVGGGFKSNSIKIEKYGLSEALKSKKKIERKLKEINDFIHAMCGEGSEEEIKLYLDLDDMGI